MSGGGKRFNIWIAYSDLFTNLSVFLFLSALGVFAAMASGKFGPGGMGAQRTCLRDLEVVGAYLRESGALQRDPAQAPPETDRGRCAQYYVVSGARFELIAPDFGYFKNSDGVPLDKPTLDRNVCMPIWRTLRRKDFGTVNGQITIMGVIREGSRYEYPAKGCGIGEQSGLRFDGIKGVWSTRRIRDCQIHARNGDSSWDGCRDILACLDTNSQSASCQAVRAADRRDRQNTRACRKSWATMQARTIFDICMATPERGGFSDDQFEAEGMVPGASRSDVLRDGWDRARFDGLAANTEAALQSSTDPNAIEPLLQGSVILIRIEVNR